MKIIALNGSPRKQWNTATLLQKALEVYQEGQEAGGFQKYPDYCRHLEGAS